MIRNIVFDMGNVLMRWDPDSFLREFFSDEEDCRAVGARLFGGAEWTALDAGAMEEDEAIARVLRDLPERLWPCDAGRAGPGLTISVTSLTWAAK